jgi:hypothetical protein
MAYITFTKDADTFSFSKGRSYPIDDPKQVNVPVDYSEGGQLYAYDKGIEEQFFNLEFERLPKTDFDNFETWLTDTAVGPKNTFTYTDEDENNHTVRLMDTRNPLHQVGHDAYSGTISLREEI